MSKEWDTKLEELRQKWASEAWSPYNPRTRSGWLPLSEIENMECVLCVGFQRAITITDDEITVACDYNERQGRIKKVTISRTPQSDLSISPNSESACTLNKFTKQA